MSYTSINKSHINNLVIKLKSLILYHFYNFKNKGFSSVDK